MDAILVTGGAGFVGSHVCKCLAAAGYRPVSYDDLSQGGRDAVRWGPQVDGDIRDGAALAAALARYQPVAVMHLAGLTQVAQSVGQPARYYQVNVGGTRVLAEAMLAQGVRRLVFSSSAAVYGAPDAVPIPENARTAPINPYGVSKRTAEVLCDALGRSGGLATVSLRYFNAAGADPDGEIGEAHDPETHLIPLVLQAALAQRPVDLFGTDHPTADGSAVRDYIHVTDIAEAHVAALRYLEGGGATARFNLGTGAGHSVKEVVVAAEQVCGTAIAIRERPRRAGDPPALVAAIELGQRTLGWRPRYSDLETILETAWRWQRRAA